MTEKFPREGYTWIGIEKCSGRVQVYRLSRSGDYGLDCIKSTVCTKATRECIRNTRCGQIRFVGLIEGRLGTSITREEAEYHTHEPLNWHTPAHLMQIHKASARLCLITCRQWAARFGGG